MRYENLKSFLECAFLFILTVILLTIFGCGIAGAEMIDLDKIIMIESSGNPRAWRKADDSRGLYQITPICLKEYNNFHPGAEYSMDDLWNTSISTVIADWYLNVRIPQMLRHFGVPDSARNRIIAYNAGISYLADNKPLPKKTVAYLKKYFL